MDDLRTLFALPILPGDDGSRLMVVRFGWSDPGKARTVAWFPFRGRIYQLDRYGLHRFPVWRPSA